MAKIHLLSGGAAQGLVSRLQARFTSETGLDIEAHFDAVGMIRDRLQAGAPCDVIILTGALIAQLTASGHIAAGSARPLGRVKTGIAVKDGVTPPPVATAAQLKQALLSANAIYFPDPLRATAGIHFMRVLKQLDLENELANSLHPYPNGAMAMQAMAEATGTGLIGCTQVTEILYAAGVQLVAPLPFEFELATTYTAAAGSRAARTQAAHALIELLASPDTASLRLACGFEPSNPD